MSRASIERVDEERIRKVAAENPDLLHNRLAQRFGISVSKLRRIIGVKVTGAGELFGRKEIAGAHYTPRVGASFAHNPELADRHRRRSEVERKLRARDRETRGGFNPDFKPMRRPNGRGGPHDGP